ncbi:hypothetical protein F4824DRAFT_456063 [Ustulina deusta]|nr:hypothetical protein F4824DRAFT_456063 [Ustulina deusta]
MPKSSNILSDGFQDVTIRKLAFVINRFSWWLKHTIGIGSSDAVSYIRPPDIRYAAIFLAAVICRYANMVNVALIGPRGS